MSDRETNQNEAQISEDLGTLTILNKGTDREYYLWSDGEQVLEIGELPEEQKNIFQKIILITMDQADRWQN